MDEARRVHPDRKELESFVNGVLEEQQRRRIEEHVSECDSCCDVLRSIPHDDVVARMQEADTSIDPGETEWMTGPTPAQQSADDLAEIPPELVDHPRYRIIKKLGSGGMGVVYQAEHRLMERPVALKVVNARLVNSDIAVERFRLEVKAAARLSHRNIVAAHDAEQAGNLHFLVMEFIEGTDLSELVRRRGELPVLHACNYVMQAAHGLQHALEQGMVHRDIKPHNLMRTPKGTIKILDFGLARFASQQRVDGEESGLTGDGMTLGTPDYIAPEQARDSRRVDIRADIYSLGCTLYYLLTGQAPFPTGTSMEKVLAHCERDPTPLSEFRQDVPAEITGIVQRMMAKDPADRFQTPADVIEALKPFGKPRESTSGSAVTDEPVSAAADDPGKPNAATQKTFVDRSPTLPPLDQLDLPDIPAQPFSPKQSRRSASQWRKFLAKYRAALSVGGVGLLVLFVGIAVFPLVRDRFSSITTGGSDVFTETEQDAEGWVDLIDKVDVSSHAVAGQWRKRGNELAVDAALSARLVLPYQPPPEYDFEVEFTRETGSNSIALLFIAGKGQASFDVDGWGPQHLAGIQNIDGRDMKENPSAAKTQQLLNGQTYTAMVRVRRGRVETFLDRNPVVTYEGDGSNLSILDLWDLHDAQVIGIGAYDSATTFHRIRVRPVGGTAP